MNAEEKIRQVAGINWYHCIDLGDGVITPGAEPKNFFNRLNFPPSLAGSSVLDIGAWDGFYSFKCEQLGADRVLATDSFCWGGGGWGTKDGFLLARKILNSKVEDKTIKPEDISPDTVGYWNIVLFLGVLYHLKNPIQALQAAWSVTSTVLFVETEIDEKFGNSVPCMIFYPGSELNKDPTNWWGPNRSCVDAMLKTLSPAPDKVELIAYGGSGNRAIFRAWRKYL